jgi:hypothetical protein
VIALAILLLTPVLFAAPAWAARQIITLTVAQAKTGEYAKKADVDISITLKWGGFTANQTMDLVVGFGKKQAEA